MGLVDVFQHTPLAITLAPPSAVIFPPPVAVVVVILLIDVVVTVGVVAVKIVP